ncbi:MAG: hypothetical protein IJK18_01795 [Clostridia bacterium]|nr:hypothetical protein [Clostridia bacterium]
MQQDRPQFLEDLSSNTSAYPEIDVFIESLSHDKLTYLENRINFISRQNHSKAVEEYINNFIKVMKDKEDSVPEINKILSDGKKLTVSDIHDYVREHFDQIGGQLAALLFSSCIKYEQAKRGRGNK